MVRILALRAGVVSDSPLTASRLRRSGVSILEVLFSIAILTTGLLGVAVLITAGRVEMGQAGRTDRFTACARAALHEVKVRGMLNPRAWIARNGDTVVRVVSYGGASYEVIPYGTTFFIDPLFIAENHDIASRGYTTVPDLDHVPYVAPSSYTPLYGSPVRRVTLDLPGLNEQTAAVNVRKAVQSATFQRLFTWQDDIMFTTPSEADERPRQVELAYNPNTSEYVTIAWPIIKTDSVPGYSASDPPKAIKTQNQGDFTWAAMVTPRGEPTIYVDLNGDGTVDPCLDIKSRLTGYSVSVVVYYKRDLYAPDLATAEKPGERVADSAAFVSGGWGGGEVVLTDSKRVDVEAEEGDWVMLPFAPDPDPFTPFHWYRVVAATREPVLAAGNWTRGVTLSGRDWRFDNNADGVINANDLTNAMLFSDVIGVYTTTIESDDVY